MLIFKFFYATFKCETMETRNSVQESDHDENGLSNDSENYNGNY